jgi:hypothetical protein
MLSARLTESARIFVVSPMRCIVSVVIFMESAILIESAMRVVSVVLLCAAFLHAPAAMTTSATTSAIRFMRSPVEVTWGTAKRTQRTHTVKHR